MHRFTYLHSDPVRRFCSSALQHAYVLRDIPGLCSELVQLFLFCEEEFVTKQSRFWQCLANHPMLFIPQLLILWIASSTTWLQFGNYLSQWLCLLEVGSVVVGIKMLVVDPLAIVTHTYAAFFCRLLYFALEYWMAVLDSAVQCLHLIFDWSLLCQVDCFDRLHLASRMPVRQFLTDWERSFRKPK